MKRKAYPVIIAIILVCSITGCSNNNLNLQAYTTSGETVEQENGDGQTEGRGDGAYAASLAELRNYSGTQTVVINENETDFSASEKATRSDYNIVVGASDSDYAYVKAVVGPDSLQDESSESNTEGAMITDYLLPGSLGGDEADDKNTATLTREAAEAILLYEDQIKDYIKETGNHVLLLKSGYNQYYRVTNVVSGIHFEAISLEDDGEGISFNVYIYNAAPNIGIDYKTGETWEATDDTAYIIDDDMMFHRIGYENLAQSAQEVETSRDELVNEGYRACPSCKP